MANTPDELKYTKTHEWLMEEDDGTCAVGISDFAQESLGDIVYVDLPEAGDEVACGDSFAEVESVKAVSEVFSPVSGTVIEVNGALLDAPELLNEDPYGAWLIKVGDVTDTEELMDAGGYDAFCEEEG